MKKRMIILFCIAFILLLLYSIAFSGERPKDFRGLTWGTNISKVSGLVLKEEPIPADTPEFIKKSWEQKEKQGIRTYIRPSDSLKVGNTQVDAIKYIFGNDQLIKIKIVFSNDMQYFFLKSLFFDLYGTPDREEKRIGTVEHYWCANNDDEANVNLTWMDRSYAKGGTVSMEWKKAFKKDAGL